MHAKTARMQASKGAWGDLCAHKGPACYPDSIDTLISLIQPNLADIWACACMQACMLWSNYVLREV